MCVSKGSSELLRLLLPAAALRKAHKLCRQLRLLRAVQFPAQQVLQIPHADRFVLAGVVGGSWQRCAANLSELQVFEEVRRGRTQKLGRLEHQFGGQSLRARFYRAQIVGRDAKRLGQAAWLIPAICRALRSWFPTCTSMRLTSFGKVGGQNSADATAIPPVDAPYNHVPHGAHSWVERRA